MKLFAVDMTGIHSKTGYTAEQGYFVIAESIDNVRQLIETEWDLTGIEFNNVEIEEITKEGTYLMRSNMWPPEE